MKTKSNRTEDIVNYIYSELKTKYSHQEIKALTNILFQTYADINSAHLLAFKDETVNESSLLNIVLATQRLKKQEPIQYILGHSEFCSLDIAVTPDVLIPRPETEELTQYIIKENQQKNLKIMDLCTGSGCIALALNKFISGSEVYALDVSESALEIARLNNRNLNLNVKFIQADLLQYSDNQPISHNNLPTTHNISTNGQNNFTKLENDFPMFDIIVSNPPYVMEKEQVMMNKNVLDYEPSLALFVKDENPLIFYGKIAVFAAKYLKKGGKIYLEINEALAESVSALFSNKEYITKTVKDIFNKDRFIFLQKII